MKFWMILLTLISTSTWADPYGMRSSEAPSSLYTLSQQSFVAAQNHAMEFNAQHIQLLQAMQNCLAGAGSANDIYQCQAQERQQEAGLRMQMGGEGGTVMHR
jgi:hypothetical protein